MGDADLMPYGKFKGIAMKELPAYYLLWLHRKHRATAEVEFYILMNWDELQIQYFKDRKK